jgi:predicted XRE-type DNA-binding protein
MPGIELPTAFRARIMGRMKEQNVSQRELARHLGIRQPKVSQKLSGEERFNERELGIVLGLLDLETFLELLPQFAISKPDRLALLDNVMDAIRKSFRKLTPHDLKEVLLGIAMLVESKPPYGISERTAPLRKMANIWVDKDGFPLGLPPLPPARERERQSA